MAEIQSEIQSEIQRISYKSKTSFGIAYEFDPVMVSWLCDHRVDACGNRFELGCLWCMAGLSGSLLSCRPLRQVQNMCALKLNFLIYTFFILLLWTDVFNSHDKCNHLPTITALWCKSAPSSIRRTMISIAAVSSFSLLVLAAPFPPFPASSLATRRMWHRLWSSDLGQKSS